jgi:hypothetical protein
MLVRRQKLPSYSKSLKTYETKLLWCSDGWVYDSVSMKRRRFFTQDNDVLNMEEEPFKQTVFSDVQYSEDIVVTILSDSPRTWIEKSSSFEECYACL